MPVYPGQGLFLKGQFANGDFCTYNRPFLIISATTSTVSALNVSSIKGKEKKLIMPSNKRISPYNPPFNLPSFVKLDEIYHFENFPELDQFLLAGGRSLHTGALHTILGQFTDYQFSKPVKIVSMSKTIVSQLNPEVQIN